MQAALHEGFSSCALLMGSGSPPVSTFGGDVFVDEPVNKLVTVDPPTARPLTTAEPPADRVQTIAEPPAEIPPTTAEPPAAMPPTMALPPAARPLSTVEPHEIDPSLDDCLCVSVSSSSSCPKPLPPALRSSTTA